MEGTHRRLRLRRGCCIIPSPLPASPRPCSRHRPLPIPRPFVLCPQHVGSPSAIRPSPPNSTSTYLTNSCDPLSSPRLPTSLSLSSSSSHLPPPRAHHVGSHSAICPSPPNSTSTYLTNSCETVCFLGLYNNSSPLRQRALRLFRQPPRCLHSRPPSRDSINGTCFSRPCYAIQRHLV